MTTTRLYRLRRPGDVELAFEGTVLADVRSRVGRDGADQPRWTEIRIYRTSTGRYVTETVGKSAFEDEEDRVTIHVVDEATQLREALKRRDVRTDTAWLTNLAVDALEAAGVHDENIALTLTEEV